MDYGYDDTNAVGVELEEIHSVEECTTPTSLASEMGLIRRRVRTLQRGYVKTRTVINLLPSRSIGRAFFADYDDVDGTIFSQSSQPKSVDSHADEIAHHLAQDKDLMANSKKSESDRIQTLREMPENLTLKRAVKKKLSKTLSRGHHKPIGYFKRLQYQTSIFFSQVMVSVKNLVYSSELWYNSLKTIEGHFGSGVATYFKFLRLLFILNMVVFLLSLAFMVTPQLVYYFNKNVNNTSQQETDQGNNFTVDNIFTGEGYFSWTILYYGFYTNNTVSLSDGWDFHIPTAYFFTSIACYFLVFISLAVSLAVSYRRSYIETAGGVKNVFAHKVFCGWDFSIVTKQAAQLKSKSLFTELKELLDEHMRPKKKRSLATMLYAIIMHISLNALLALLIGTLGYYMWVYLNGDTADDSSVTTFCVCLVLALVVALAPSFFSWIVRFEEYDTPRAMLYITIIRIFLLDVVIIGVVAAFRIQRSGRTDCWETVVGQDVYRLVLLDFFLNLLGTLIAEFIRSRLVSVWPRVGYPEFDVARNSMSLIYNQTLFYVGLYFSPLLPAIIILKMFLTFYIRKLSALRHCRPPVRPWRAAQSQTVFLAMATLAFFLVIVAYGYVLTSVRTSLCGPFRGNRLTYTAVLETILPHEGEVEPVLLTIILYAARPGVVAVLLFLMLLGVYYLRSVAHSRRHVVHMLRQILADKARDKELLLQEMDRLTRNAGGALFDEHDMRERETVVVEDYGSRGDHRQTAGVEPGSFSHVSKQERKKMLRNFRSTQHLNAGIEDGATHKGWKSVDNLDYGLNQHASQMRLVEHPVDNISSDPEDFHPKRTLPNFNPVYSPSEELQDLEPELEYRHRRSRHSDEEEDTEVGIGPRSRYTRQSYDDKVPSRIGFTSPKQPHLRY